MAVDCTRHCNIHVYVQEYGNWRKGKIVGLRPCHLFAYHQVQNLEADIEHQRAPHHVYGTHVSKFYEKAMQMDEW